MSGIRIVAFGDSVTEGISAKLDTFYYCFQYKSTTVNRVRDTQTWSSILERILIDWIEGDVKVINAGIKGSTTAKAVNRLECDVLSKSPDYVLVMFGSEDVLEGVKIEAFKKNLEKIVDGIIRKNASPVLMTPVPFSERMTACGCSIYELRQRQAYLLKLAHAVRSIAKEKSISLIDLNRYFLSSRLAYDHLFEGWLPDGVAQSAMASFIAGTLLSIIGVEDFPRPTLCDYRKIYSDAENPDTMHNGFTDITYFRGEFFVAFRTGRSHGVPSKPGVESVVVLCSQDGITWTKDAILQVEGFDNRDPKFLQTDDLLMLYTPCLHLNDQPGHTHAVTYGFERIGNDKWGGPFECVRCFFWRPRKWGHRYVVAPYLWPEKDVAVKLLGSPDGRTWDLISNILALKTDGNETDLLIDNDKLMAFSRSAGGSRDEMLVSTYIPKRLAGKQLRPTVLSRRPVCLRQEIGLWSAAGTALSRMSGSGN